MSGWQYLGTWHEFGDVKFISIAVQSLPPNHRIVGTRCDVEPGDEIFVGEPGDNLDVRMIEKYIGIDEFGRSYWEVKKFRTYEP